MSHPITEGQGARTTDSMTQATAEIAGTSADSRCVRSTEGQLALEATLQPQASSSSGIGKKRKISTSNPPEEVASTKARKMMIELSLRNGDNNMIQFNPKGIAIERLLDQLNGFEEALDDEVEPCVFIREINNEQGEVVARITLNAACVEQLKKNMHTLIEMLDAFWTKNAQLSVV
ncbi:hypothetical protein [Kistimonas asteriae]|uniref:hypothetical protein n=1 Tax=Kistimonas asteriae TaxID=517724 RepID=UPI001BA8BFDD|nr:hypothetical protein [Kistimonas asteriae]